MVMKMKYEDLGQKENNKMEEQRDVLLEVSSWISG